MTVFKSEDDLTMGCLLVKEVKGHEKFSVEINCPGCGSIPEEYLVPLGSNVFKCSSCGYLALKE